MEIDIKQAEDWALTVIGNTYHAKDIPEIEKQFKAWFHDREGWYDVTTNPSDYMGQGIITVFMENFYKHKK